MNFFDHLIRKAFKKMLEFNCAILSTNRYKFTSNYNALFT